MDWAFTDPPDAAVITTKYIVNRAEWIAFVSHDEDDGTWQFHAAGRAFANECEPVGVSLLSIVEIDPTLKELARLPLGWQALRASPSAQWQWEKSPAG